MSNDGKKWNSGNSLLLPHGGYKKLKTFQLAQLIYDITVIFCQKYIDPKSRTRDQMTQAARSGVQNIAEGSIDAATSSKIELNLYNVARGSLVELQTDYEDFLRQRNYILFPPESPTMQSFKKLKCQTVEEFREWVNAERKNRVNTEKHRNTRGNTEMHRAETPPSVSPRVSPCLPEYPCSPSLVANGVLSLLNLTIYLLQKQINAKEKLFLKNGGFSENMARQRKSYK